MDKLDKLKKVKELLVDNTKNKDAINQADEIRKTIMMFSNMFDFLKGESGKRGFRGETGFKGNDGERGLMGLMGKDGKIGPPGQKGEQGIRGLTGFTGKQGEPAVPVDEKKLSDNLLQLLIDRLDGKLKEEIPKKEKKILDELEQKLIHMVQRMQVHGGGTHIHVGVNPPSSPRLNSLWVDTN